MKITQKLCSRIVYNAPNRTIFFFKTFTGGGGMPPDRLEGLRAFAPWELSFAAPMQITWLRRCETFVILYFGIWDI